MKCSCILLFTFLCLNVVVVQIDAINQCNSKISDFILKHNNRPKGVLKRLNEFGAMTYLVNPVDRVSDDVECVIGAVSDADDQGFYDATVTTLYRNKSVEVGRFKESEGECGHVTEYEADGSQLEIYFYLDNTYQAVCYYLCYNSTVSTESGVDFGACEVAFAKRNDKETLKAMNTGKALLKKAGLTEIVDIEGCSGDQFRQIGGAWVP